MRRRLLFALICAALIAAGAALAFPNPVRNGGEVFQPAPGAATTAPGGCPGGLTLPSYPSKCMGDDGSLQPVTTPEGPRILPIAAPGT